MLLGAHTSIAGGIDKAIERGDSLHCTAIQIFTKNSNQWKGKTLSPDEIEHYHDLKKRSKIKTVIAHDSYLINLASGSDELRLKSVEALTDEVERCRMLEIPVIVIHPGAHLGIGEDAGIKNIADSLNAVMEKTDGSGVSIALEITAGQGTCIGHRFEHLARIIALVKDKERVRTCLDSAHLFAAGYDISSPEGYKNVIDEFDRVIGLDRLSCFHVNDSKKGLNSRVDRHEHIGKGFIGKEFFSLLMRDKRFENIPKIIETPKDKDLKEDRINLSLLRKMAARTS
ncbi:MAG: deoxyribonuclease IV [Nitrospirae bacterium]|nr:deoxyribonuclease IV [Nitrospirota bacterium]